MGIHTVGDDPMTTSGARPDARVRSGPTLRGDHMKRLLLLVVLAAAALACSPSSGSSAPSEVPAASAPLESTAPAESVMPSESASTAP